MSRLRKLRQVLVDATCGHRVVYHHVPKCGGTSVRQALRVRYALSYTGFGSDPVYRALEALYPGEDPTTITRRVIEYRQIQLFHFLCEDIRCISGHVPFSPRAHELFADRYKFITTLRDPVELLISSYFYSAQLEIDRWKAVGDLEAYLETHRARQLGSVYSQFFSGLDREVDPVSAQSIERAKANLAKFSVIGFVEDMPAFQGRLRDVLGVRLRIGHENRSRLERTDRADAITPRLRVRIEDLSAPNIEIYEFARRELAR